MLGSHLRQKAWFVILVNLSIKNDICPRIYKLDIRWLFRCKMASEKLVLNHVLKFILQARKAECTVVSIMKIACDFFKTSFRLRNYHSWSCVCPTYWTGKKPGYKIDIIRAIDVCYEKKALLPCYVVSLIKGQLSLEELP